LVLTASLLSTQHYRVRVTTAWLARN